MVSFCGNSTYDRISIMYSSNPKCPNLSQAFLLFYLFLFGFLTCCFKLEQRALFSKDPAGYGLVAQSTGGRGRPRLVRWTLPHPLLRATPGVPESQLRGHRSPLTLSRWGHLSGGGTSPCKLCWAHYPITPARQVQFHVPWWQQTRVQTAHPMMPGHRCPVEAMTCPFSLLPVHPQLPE